MTETHEVCITVLEGRNLAAKDSTGTSDPFVVLKLGKQEHKTNKQMKTLNPRWNEKCYFKSNATETLEVKVWDWDRIGSNDYMGEVSIPLAETAAAGETTKWYPLVAGHGHSPSEVSGEVQIRIQMVLVGNAQTAAMSAQDLRNYALSMGQHPHAAGSSGHPSHSPSALPPTPGAPAAPPPPAAPATPAAPPPPPAPFAPAAPPPPATPAAGGSDDRPLPPLPPPEEAGPAPRTAKALYDWTAQNDGELPSVKAGEIVNVKDASDATWWFVEVGGREGYIASNYLG
jgi:hypothetical protein